MSDSTIAARCRPDGPWRRLLPGVILLSGGEPTRRQQLRAAIARAGPESVITGIDALCAYGMSMPLPPRVRLLVPSSRRMQTQEFLVLERTSRVPQPVFLEGLPFAPPTRATLDVARQAHDPDVLRRLVTLPVYYGLCTAEQLRAELDAGSQRGSAAVRALLRHLGSMGDTYVQGLARRLVKRAPLPAPEWNVTVRDIRGRPIGHVDAWWHDVAVGWQFGAQGCPETEPKMTHLALTAAGVILVRTRPERLHEEPEAVIRELTSAFGEGTRRPRPRIQPHGMERAA
ncbi:hypothetical protein [Amycolatopsis anabasis]|uniref:hypothetical protein n=1 Tax=Amycolatopsis anabasis TaxID=1840409 RepID=UPI001FE309CD|nr:hypothetical protein [Amycolatopsis anabasis]